MRLTSVALLLRPLLLARIVLALSWTVLLALVAVSTVSLGIWAGDHVMPRLWARMVLRLLGVDVEVRGQERIDPLSSYVFVANHRSYLDALVVLSATRRVPRFVGAMELGRYPVFGAALGKLGHVLIDRRDPKRAYATLREAAARIGSRYSVFFAPEGTRARCDPRRCDGTELGPFKDGAFVYAQAARLPVVPIALSGTARLWPPGTAIVNQGRVTIEFGRPFATDAAAIGDVKSQVREWIKGALAARAA